MHIHIRGDGLAAWCSARLLSQSGLHVSVDRPRRRHSRLILIGDPTQALLAELAGNPTLFQNLPRIRKRVVAWGSEVREFDHSAAIVNEPALLDDLWSRTAFEETGGEADWNIFASLPIPAKEQGFGTRTANLAEVELRGARETCWIESFEQGWMFLIAGDTPTGYLISVGGHPDTFLASSQSIAKEIAEVRSMAGEIPAFPRIASPMFGADWLACGTAAMALDPLCGDGAGHAVREAILAAAVLRSVAMGSEPAGLLQHYEARLGVAFERHLKICEGFYMTGGDGDWWKSELDLLRQGQEFCRARSPRDWHYRLEGLYLKPL